MSLKISASPLCIAPHNDPNIFYVFIMFVGDTWLFELSNPNFLSYEKQIFVKWIPAKWIVFLVEFWNHTEKISYASDISRCWSSSVSGISTIPSPNRNLKKFTILLPNILQNILFSIGTQVHHTYILSARNMIFTFPGDFQFTSELRVGGSCVMCEWNRWFCKTDVLFFAT